MLELICKVKYGGQRWNWQQQRKCDRGLQQGHPQHVGRRGWRDLAGSVESSWFGSEHGGTDLGIRDTFSWSGTLPFSRGGQQPSGTRLGRYGKWLVTQ